VRFIDLRRLAIGSIVLAAVSLPLYFFVLRPDGSLEPGFSNAVLLDTPPARGLIKVGLREGELAPNFEISTPDGSRVRLSDYRGKPVLISFFALWCGSCLAEMPDIKALQEQRGLNSFSVIAINTGETRSRALEFIDFIQAPFVWGLDFDLTVSDAYGVYGLPYTIYVDSDGIVRVVYSGLAEKARLEAYVETAFNASVPPSLPGRLRTISNIPRDRVVTVETRATDRVLFTSRSLRCDASYCASSATERIRGLVGIQSVRTGIADGIPSLEVRFDPTAIEQSLVINTLVSALEGLHDPVYETALEVRFLAN